MSGLGTRQRALEKLAATEREPVDLLVVGGGITGAGIALDAASRGLSVALIERADFASGTSSKSSKLVHGGLRYLEQREFGLMREAAQERDLLRRLAPQLVEPIPFVLPVSDRWNRARFALGLWAYDALASFKNLAVHRYLGVDETEEAVPALPTGKVKGGFLFYDCRNDDVRLVMEVLIQAVRYGAIVLNHSEVIGLSGSEAGCSATIRERVSGDEFEIRARRTIVAAGVWSDRLESLASEGADPRLRPSKGVHLSFSRRSLPVNEAAAFIPDVERRRFLFVIPWLGSVIVGTTDTTYEGDLDTPTVDDADRRYIIDSVNAVFEVDLSDRDVTGAWAGLRPLVAGKAGSTADLSRKHSIYEIAPGIIGITGGKLTTYRRMAADAVDHFSEDLGGLPDPKTRWIRLGTGDLDALRLAVERRARSLDVSEAGARDLVRRYGDRALHVLDIAASEDLTGPLVAGRASVAAEALYCVRSEMAVDLSDLLARRTRLALIDPAAGIGPSSRAAALMGAELGWNQVEMRRQIDRHGSEVSTERSLDLGAETEIPPQDGLGAG